jgi:hypothetical protein
MELAVAHQLQLDHQTYSQDELIMAMKWNMGNTIETKPKKTAQGRGQHTKYSATSRNKAKKRYRGQGK